MNSYITTPESSSAAAANSAPLAGSYVSLASPVDRPAGSYVSLPNPVERPAGSYVSLPNPAAVTPTPGRYVDCEPRLPSRARRSYKLAS